MSLCLVGVAFGGRKLDADVSRWGSTGLMLWYEDVVGVRVKVLEMYLLAFCVQRWCGLIQQQDLRVAYDRPGDGDSLLLTTGQLGTLGAHIGVILLKWEDKEGLAVVCERKRKKNRLKLQGALWFYPPPCSHRLLHPALSWQTVLCNFYKNLKK